MEIRKITVDEFMLTCLPLATTHYKEVPYKADKSGKGINVDEQLYLSMESRGALVIHAAFEQGEVVGYIVGMVGVQPHTKQKIVNIMSFYTAKIHRGKGIATRLYNVMAKECKAKGVYSSHFIVNESFPETAGYAERLGMEKLETVYGRKL